MRYGFRHPLDVELADFADDLVDSAQRDEIEEHLADCLLCRIKLRRLRDDLGEPPASTASAADSSDARGVKLTFASPRPIRTARAGLEPGQLWSAGGPEATILFVIRLADDRVLVAPVTFDVFSADDETVVVDGDRSPFGLSLAVYPMLATELPRSKLADYFGALVEPGEVDELLVASSSGTSRGEPIDGPTDPRLEFRQALADQLGDLDEVAPDPETSADAPPPSPERVAAALVAKLHELRGTACNVYRLGSWEELFLAYSRAWQPVARVDELGTILVVFDTKFGLADETDYDAAMSVLTRFNASAVVVLATGLSGTADIFDAASLTASISVPSGEISQPGPLLAGLAPADAIAKFLDQNSAWSEGSWSARAVTSPADVPGTLSRAAASAIEEVVRQGRRARIATKVAGYASVENLAGVLDDILRGALTGDQVAQRLSEVADRSKP